MPAKKSGKAKGSKAKGKRKKSSGKKRAASRGRPPRKGGKRGRTRKKSQVHHNPVPLVVALAMVVVILVGLFMISEYPDDKNNIQIGIGALLAIGILLLMNSMPKGAPSGGKRGSKGRGGRRSAGSKARPKPTASGPTITPAPLAGGPTPLPLQVPMATVAPPKPAVQETTPLGVPGAPTAAVPTPVRPQMKARSAIMPRARITYPVNVGGGDYANTHILVNKDTILQLRSPLVPDFSSDGFPAGTPAVNTFPRKAYEAPAMPEVGPEAPMMAPAPVAGVPAAPMAVPGVSPVAPMAVTPEIAAVTPVAVTPEVAGVTPVAPAAAAPETEEEDDMMVDFGDDEEDDDMDWG